MIVYVTGSPGHNGIPQSIGGYTTEIVKVGRVRALSLLEPLLVEREQRYRPVPGGVSISHYKGTAGSSGFVVDIAGEPYGIGNNHVIANSDAYQRRTASFGDPVLQPGSFDGGVSPNDAVGGLYDWVPIDITGRNRADVALWRPSSPDMISREVLGIGTPSGYTTFSVDDRIRLSGRTSGVSSGTVRDVDALMSVDYSGFSAVFEHCIVSTKMADPGDSGAPVLEEAGLNIGAQCFAGSEFITLSNHVDDLFTALSGPRAASVPDLASLLPIPLGLGIMVASMLL